MRLRLVGRKEREKMRHGTGNINVCGIEAEYEYLSLDVYLVAVFYQTTKAWPITGSKGLIT